MASLHQHEEYETQPDRDWDRQREWLEGPFADFVEALDELERTVNRHLSLRLVLLLCVSVLLMVLLVTR